jgi:hypothetical protein
MALSGQVSIKPILSMGRKKWPMEPEMGSEWNGTPLTAINLTSSLTTLAIVSFPDQPRALQ